VRFTLEAYYKAYRHFPLDPAQPALFTLDEPFYTTQPMSLYLGHERLEDTGRARTRGLEALLQKKLARNVYGVVSAAYFRSRYRAHDGVWRDRVFDNRYLFTAEGGYKPNPRHEFSLRWTYAGGAPYTPFDVEASRALQHGVFDEARINGARRPSFHALNVRYDRRFHFARSSLVTYLSLWNAYDRRNVAAYFWDEVDNAPGIIRQWGLLPVFGVEWEL
jgi:hypothetical protein